MLQVAIALSGGEIVYFEMDPSGQLNEFTERMEMESEVTSMAVAAVPPGLQRSRFLGVGYVSCTCSLACAALTHDVACSGG